MAALGSKGKDMEEQLDKLAFSFFKLFAQYESYLKEHDYFQVTNSGKINVDWDRFVNEIIGQNYVAKLGDKAASAEYILSEPPKKQVVNLKGKLFGLMLQTTKDLCRSYLVTSHVYETIYIMVLNSTGHGLILNEVNNYCITA